MHRPHNWQGSWTRSKSNFPIWKPHAGWISAWRRKSHQNWCSPHGEKIRRKDYQQAGGSKTSTRQDPSLHAVQQCLSTIFCLLYALWKKGCKKTRITSVSMRIDHFLPACSCRFVRPRFWVFSGSPLIRFTILEISSSLSSFGRCAFAGSQCKTQSEMGYS